jgi:hypothetical protein
MDLQLATVRDKAGAGMLGFDSLVIYVLMVKSLDTCILLLDTIK